MTTTTTTTTTDAPADLQLEQWCTGRIFFTSDLHLGHERIIELCGRPYGSVGEMNMGIVENINATVSSRHSLVILGDVLLGKIEESLKLLKEIRAKRVLILPGNHDRFSLAYGHHGALETQRVKRQLWISEYEGVRRNRSLHCVEDRVRSAWSTTISGRRVLLSHYPYVGDSQPERDRHRHLRPVDTGLPLVHGHVHTRWRENGRMLNVGVDVNRFKPVAESEVAEWLASAPMGLGLGSRVG
jgi:calcineurin-like phosphoesterase family protein